jgi:hypothetical protein
MSKDALNLLNKIKKGEAFRPPKLKMNAERLSRTVEESNVKFNAEPLIRKIDKPKMMVRPLVKKLETKEEPKLKMARLVRKLKQERNNQFTE